MNTYSSTARHWNLLENHYNVLSLAVFIPPQPLLSSIPGRRASDCASASGLNTKSFLPHRVSLLGQTWPAHCHFSLPSVIRSPSFSWDTLTVWNFKSKYKTQGPVPLPSSIDMVNRGNEAGVEKRAP